MLTFKPCIGTAHSWFEYSTQNGYRQCTICGQGEFTKKVSPSEQGTNGSVPEGYPSPCLCPDCLPKTAEPEQVGSGMGQRDADIPSSKSSPMRVFQTGATRDTNDGKLNYHGFLSPEVLERYAKYMHKHRIQSDGSLREASNWKKGMPKLQYIESLIRHVLEFWKDPNQETACAIMFNVMGWLYEELRVD